MELSLIILFSRALLNSGASSNLIQSSAEALVKKFHCDEFRLVITSEALIASAKMGSDDRVVEIENRRDTALSGNAYILEKLLIWAEGVNTSKKSLVTLKSELMEMIKTPRLYKRFYYPLASGIGSAMVGFMLGGGWVDLAIIFISACVVEWIQILSSKWKKIPSSIVGLLAVAVGGIIAAELTLQFSSTNYFINIVSSMIFFMPGRTMILGIMELISGNSTLGVKRVVNASVLMLSMIVGIAIAMSVVPDNIAIVKSPVTLTLFSGWVGHLLGAGSTALLAISLTVYYSIQKRFALFYAMGGFLVQLCYMVVTKQFLMPGYVGAFVALAVLTLFAYRFQKFLGYSGRLNATPAYYVSAMMAVALFPGVGFIRAIDGFIRIAQSSLVGVSNGLVTETLYYSANTLVTLVSMILAIVITASIIENGRSH